MSEGGARVLAGRYELGPIIGRGGMAEVYRAHDRTLERDVAVKLVADGASKERFVVEARRTAQIRHPAIVEVFDVGFDQDAFMVMALLEGETLEARLSREGALHAREAVMIAAQVCDALAAAHAQGVVHRDVKPGNVFLPSTRPGAETLVKVLDFGVAKRVDGATIETDPGMLIGTLAYMAPEQIRGEELDGRSDLYALGVVLYRCLCGRLPFERANMASLIHAHLRVEPPALSGPGGARELLPLDAVVRSMLAKRPAERPEHAAAARAALLAALAESGAGTIAIPALALPATAPELALDAEPPVEPPAQAIAPPAPAIEREPEEVVAPGREDALSFEIDHGLPAPAKAPAAPAPLVYPHQDRFPAHIAPPAPAGFLATFPTSVSKRLAGYGALTLLVLHFFFRVSPVVSITLGVITIFGLVAFLAATRR